MNCNYHKCRKPSFISLYSTIEMCEQHWDQYCRIDLIDEPGDAQILIYEQRCLEFQVKCNHKPAVRLLEKLQNDSDKYVLQFTGICGHDDVEFTLADYREALKAFRDPTGKYYAGDDDGHIGPMSDTMQGAANEFVWQYRSQPTCIALVINEDGEVKIVWDTNPPEAEEEEEATDGEEDYFDFGA